MQRKPGEVFVQIEADRNRSCVVWAGGKSETQRVFYFHNSNWGWGGAVVWELRLGVGWGEQEGSVRSEESGGERWGRNSVPRAIM